MNRIPPSYRGKRPRFRAFLAAIVTVVPAGAALVATGSVASASVPAPPSGWSTVWSDDFNGAAGTAPNTSNWLYDTGTGYPGGAANWGTGEVETMTTSTANVYQDGYGNLAIKPIRDANGNWTSGRIETQRNDFAPPAGGILRVSARVELPNVSGAGAQGYWPAFWMLGGNFRGNYNNWPSIGEMDTLEAVDGQSQVHGTFHCGVNPGGPCNETTGLGGPATPSSNPWGTWHNYTIEWDTSTSPQQLRWYVDGDSSTGATPYWTVSQNQVDATTWQEATDHGYMIILNVAMGGGWPGNPTSSTVSGAPMLVDYVDVTEKSGGGGGTMQGDPITGPGGKCIDVAGDDTGGDTSAVQLWDCQSYAIDQHWTYTNNTLQTLGKCMDISGGSNAEGTKIQLYDCIANDAYQTWIHESNGALYNPVTGYCLDDPYDSTTNGNQLWTWVCNGSDAQTWTSAQFGSSGGSTTIQAESYTNQSGTQTEACSDSGGGQDVGYISNGDWLEYGNLNFGSGLSNFQARVASGAAAGVSGTVSVVLDNLNNAPIGSFSVSNTGGWQTWETVPIGISATSGTHTVYLKFSTGSGQDFTNLNWFTLS